MNKIKTNLNLFDFLLLLALTFSTTGFILAKAEKTPLNQIIKDKEGIAIELLIPDVFSTSDKSKESFFKTGDKTAITIRNRPYTKLSIIKSETKPKMTVIPSINGTFKAIEDPTKVNFKDHFVTISDTALRTDDGYVIGGNKIKIGNQIELEGFNYRLTGKVINIYPLNE